MDKDSTYSILKRFVHSKSVGSITNLSVSFIFRQRAVQKNSKETLKKQNKKLVSEKEILKRKTFKNDVFNVIFIWGKKIC